MFQNEQKVDHLTKSLLQDYQKGRDIDRMDFTSHPNKAAVMAIAKNLLRILYPVHLPAANADASLAALPAKTLRMLDDQLSRVGMDGETVGIAFMEKIPQLRALAQTDVDAAFAGDPAAANADEIIFCYPGLFAITVYRLAHELYHLQVPLIPRMLTEYAHSRTGIDIHPGATIGDHFFIDHGTGIVIGQTAIIGSHVKIYQGVTLGGLTTRGGQSLRGQKRHPTIEDRVTIYANATILGGDTVIGHDSIIGASAFITQSVSPCTTVFSQDQPLHFRLRHWEGDSEEKES